MKYTTEIDMVETVLKNNFPTEFHAEYVAKGVFNRQENYFNTIGDGKTKWTSVNEFKFGHFMMKLMGFIMPGVFKKQSCQYQQDFKNFVEHNSSVTEKA